MRDPCEIRRAEEELTNRLWLERHLTLAKQGDVGDEARLSAERMAAELGEESVGSYTDFEWGMLNGRLAALRWILGGEGDDLSS